MGPAHLSLPLSKFPEPKLSKNPALEVPMYLQRPHNGPTNTHNYATVRQNIPMRVLFPQTAKSPQNAVLAFVQI
jgi:hypothetical protein